MRPHLEYDNMLSVFVSIKKIILSIENVQHIVTKIIQYYIKHLTYKKRLRYIDLPTLECRRSRGDMIETYKMLNGKYDIAATPYLQPFNKK